MSNNNKCPKAKRVLPALAALPLCLMAVSSQAETLEERVARLEAALAAQQQSENKTAAKPSDSKTEYSFGGYIKLDAISSQYSGGERATSAVGDDFLVASTIPVGGESGDANVDMQARHSRLWFKTVTPTAAGQLSSYIEMDFGVNQIGDERISNSSVNRIRQAYVSWQYDADSSLLAGQAWSTFFNVASLPETLDFVGPVGTLFERQSQLRWTHGLDGGSSVMFALENPSTGLYGAAGSEAGGSAYDNNSLPDVVLRYNGSHGSLSYSLATVFREIAYKQDFNNSAAVAVSGDESEMGYGVSAAMIWKLGADDLKVQLNAGNALGRYMGLQSYRDGMIEDSGDIELIDEIGGFIAYRHFWNDQWRSSVVLSASSADNPDDVAATTSKSYQSLHLNLLYSPIAALTLGAEFIHASRNIEGEVNGDDSGELDRLQFSVKYVF